LIFFSLSRSKLPGYILPALPAGTLLVAEYVSRRVAGQYLPNHDLPDKDLSDQHLPNMAVIVLHSLQAALPLVPALFVQYLILQHRIPWGREVLIPSLFALTLAIGIGVTLLSSSGLRMLRFVTLIPVVLMVTAVLRFGAPVLNDNLSARPLADEIQKIQ